MEPPDPDGPTLSPAEFLREATRAGHQEEEAAGLIAALLGPQSSRELLAELLAPRSAIRTAADRRVAADAATAMFRALRGVLDRDP